jgi:hypothetical protein
MGLHANFIQKQLIPWIFYFALISLVRLRLDLSLLSWWTGALIAAGFMVFERLLHFLWLHPELDESKHLAALLKSKHYREIFLSLVSQNMQAKRLLGLSVLFLASWMVMALFIVTSSASFLAKGLVMGIGLRPTLLMLKYWNHPSMLSEQLFWQIKRPLSDKEIHTLSFIFIAFFGLLSVWLMVW